MRSTPRISLLLGGCYSFYLLTLALPLLDKRSRFLSFLAVAKIMARVGGWRNLRSATKKRRNSGESGQLLNNNDEFLRKGLIRETRSRPGCNEPTSNCSGQSDRRRAGRRNRVWR